jgi:protein-tyrosine phosphatase
MVDLHCHILPQVDDGPATLEESLWMARFLVDDGVTHVVATPHCHRYTHLLRADILPHVANLNSILESANIPLKILPGSEIQVTESAMYCREFDEKLYCHLNDAADFTLLEFNWLRDRYPPDAKELIRWIRDRGTTPILAHPERHNFFWDDPEMLSPLVNAGAWLQITVDSLLGNHGAKPKIFGERFLRAYPDCVLASDAHNLRRCSGLSAGYDLVRQHLGSDRADDLMRRARIVVGLDSVARKHEDIVI